MEESPLDEQKIKEESEILQQSVMNLLESNRLLIEAVAKLLNQAEQKDEELSYKLKKAYHLFSTGHKGLKKIKFIEDKVLQ